MRLRLRGPSGASTLRLSDSATVADLKHEITKSTSLTNFDIKYSYPPKPLVLPQDDTLLSDLSVKLNGEQLTISESASPRSSIAASAGTRQAATPPPPTPRHVEQLVQSINVPKFAGMTESSNKSSSQKTKHTYENPKPIPLQKKKMAEDTPELPLPDRGATLGMSPYSSPLITP